MAQWTNPYPSTGPNFKRWQQAQSKQSLFGTPDAPETAVPPLPLGVDADKAPPPQTVASLDLSPEEQAAVLKARELAAQQADAFQRLNAGKETLPGGQVSIGGMVDPTLGIQDPVQRAAMQMGPGRSLRPAPDMSGVSEEERSLILRKRQQALGGGQGRVDPSTLTGVPQQGMTGGAGGFGLTPYPTTEGLRKIGQQVDDLTAKYASGVAKSQELLGVAQAAQLEAQAKASGIGQAMGAAQAAALKQQHEEMLAYDAQQKQRESQRQEWVRSKYDAINAAGQEFDEASRSYNPVRFWAKADGSSDYGKRIMGAIIIGLGEYAAAKTGGPNRALSIIDDAVNRDLEAQKMRIQATGEKARMADTAYANALRQTGSERAAVEADRVKKLDGLQRYLETIRANYAAPQEAARFEAFSAGLTAQKAEAQQRLAGELHSASFGAVQAKAENEKAIFSGGMQRAGAMNQAAMMRAQAAGAGAAREHPDLQAIPGTMPTEKDWEAAKEQDAKLNPALSTIRDLIDWRDQNFSLEKSAVKKDKTAQMLANQARLAMGNLVGIKGRSFMALIDTLGIPADPEEWNVIGQPMIEKLRTLVKSIEKQHAGFLKGHLIMPRSTSQAVQQYGEAR